LPRVVDSRSDAVYVLVPESEYEALRENLENQRRQQGIRAVGLRNAAGRLDEAISRNPMRPAFRWGRFDKSQPALPDDEGLEALDAKTVFFDWERLRLAYNAILVGVVLCSLRFVGVSEHPFWEVYLVGDAIVANVFFCAGPVAEGYLCWLGLDRHRARWMAFLLGTFIAVWGTVIEMERLAGLPAPLGGGFFLLTSPVKSSIATGCESRRSARPANELGERDDQRNST
jgi:hypothetical protein